MRDSLGSKVTKPGVRSGKAETSVRQTPIVKTQNEVKKADLVDDTKAKLNLHDPELKAAEQRILETHIAPLVHAQTQSIVDTILKEFDNTYRYGPCVGITRLERWDRADRLGLNPPSEVRKILQTREGESEQRYRECFLEGAV